MITDKSESFMQLKARFQAEFKPRYSTRTAPVGAAGGGAAVAPRGTARACRGQESATDDPGARGRASCCGVLLLSGNLRRSCGAGTGCGKGRGLPPKSRAEKLADKAAGKKKTPKRAAQKSSSKQPPGNAACGSDIKRDAEYATRTIRPGVRPRRRTRTWVGSPSAQRGQRQINCVICKVDSCLLG